MSSPELRLVARSTPGSQLKGYFPLEKNPGLFRVFSTLRGKDEIRRFADLYGTLFDEYTEEPVEGGTLGKDPIGKLFGTSLTNWEREIAAMRVLVKLWESILVEDVKELSHIVRWEDDRSVGYEIPSPRHRLNSFKWLWLPAFGSHSPNLFKPGDVLLPAKYALQDQVNARLADLGMGISLSWTPDLQQRITITPPNLLAGMWLQFAQAVTGKYLLKKCQGCGDYFQAGPGARRSDAETCSNTCRQRKARKPK